MKKLISFEIVAIAVVTAIFYGRLPPVVGVNAIAIAHNAVVGITAFVALFITAASFFYAFAFIQGEDGINLRASPASVSVFVEMIAAVLTVYLGSLIPAAVGIAVLALAFVAAHHRPQWFERSSSTI